MYVTSVCCGVSYPVQICGVMTGSVKSVMLLTDLLQAFTDGIPHLLISCQVSKLFQGSVYRQLKVTITHLYETLMTP